MKTNITLTGASGRMGRELICATLEEARCQLVGAMVRQGSVDLGVDVGHFVNKPKMNVMLTDQIESVLNQTQVMIDFSVPNHTIEILSHCQSHNIPIVIGTTGFDEKQQAEIHQVSKSIPIIMAPNTSTSVNLMFKLLQLATEVIGSDADIDVLDKHHRNKIDAPSGTALQMGKVIADTLNLDWKTLSTIGVESDQNRSNRDVNRLNFSSIRAGGIHGEHTVSFVMAGEEITITHRAFNRHIYALGAIRAALWLVQSRQPNLYSMSDVLAISNT